MPPMQPKPPVKKKPTQYLAKPMEESTAGELFRVRDKDWEAVWDENLTWADATKLKEKVVTSGKSRSARVESMRIPPPDWYQQQLDEVAGGNEEQTVAETPAAKLAPAPARAADAQLAAMRQPAMAAAQAAAAEANRRRELGKAQQHAAAKDRSAAVRPLVAVPAAPKPRPKPPVMEIRPVPVVSTELPDENDELEANVDPGELGSFVADSGSDRVRAEDVARMRKRQGEAPAIVFPKATPELTLRAKALYLEECKRRGGGQPFEKLHKTVQDHWRLEASKPVAEDEPEAEADAVETATEMAPNVADMVAADAPAVDALIDQSRESSPAPLEREAQTITAADVGSATDVLGST